MSSFPMETRKRKMIKVCTITKTTFNRRSFIRCSSSLIFVPPPHQLPHLQPHPLQQLQFQGEIRYLHWKCLLNLHWRCPLELENKKINIKAKDICNLEMLLAFASKNLIVLPLQKHPWDSWEKMTPKIIRDFRSILTV